MGVLSLSRFNRRSFHTCLPVAAVFASLACEVEPRESLIVAPRVLGLRTEIESSWLPTNDARAPYRADVFPFDWIVVRPYVAGPSGEIDPTSLQSQVIVCPYRAEKCLAMPEAPSQIVDCPTFTQPTTAVFLRESLGELPCRARASAGELPRFQLPWYARYLQGAAPRLVWIASTSDGPGVAVCETLYFEKAREMPAQCLVALLELEVGPWKSLEAVFERALAQIDALPALEISVSLDGQGEDVPTPLLVPIVETELKQLDHGQTSRLRAGQEARLRDGETVLVSALRGAATETAIDVTPQALQASPTIALYSTYGQVGSATVSPARLEMQRKFGDPPLLPGNRAYLYVVVDDHGAMTWQTIEVVVESDRK